MAAVQRNLFGRIAGTRDACKYLLPNAFLTPTGKAVVDRLVRTIFFGQSCQRQPIFSTCMIPLKMRRSSLRLGPGWLKGKCGTIFAHCSSLNQNKFAPMTCPPKPVDQALEPKHH